MIIGYTQEEFETARSLDPLRLICTTCGKAFFRSKKEVKRVLRGAKRAKYCSKECANNAGDTAVKVQCKQCGKWFFKQASQARRFPNHFCSSSCAATYNNTHKIKGTRVSKLERWLIAELPKHIQDGGWLFNRKDAIGSELDIYMPEFKLAFEINGIFHFKPIYGAKKLKQIKASDAKKKKVCEERGIELHVLNVSHHIRFRKDFCQETLHKILSVVCAKIDERDAALEAKKRAAAEVGSVVELKANPPLVPFTVVDMPLVNSDTLQPAGLPVEDVLVPLTLMPDSHRPQGEEAACAGSAANQ